MSDESHIREVLLAKRTDVGAPPTYGALHRRDKPAQHSKQRGFAAAVRPGHAKALPWAHGKADVAENGSIAARAFESHCFQHGQITAIGADFVPACAIFKAG